jgi:hypothetical protein
LLTQLNPDPIRRYTIRIRNTDFGAVMFEVVSVPASGHGTEVPGFSPQCQLLLIQGPFHVRTELNLLSKYKCIFRGRRKWVGFLARVEIGFSPKFYKCGHSYFIFALFPAITVLADYLCKNVRQSWITGNVTGQRLEPALRVLFNTKRTR